MEVRTIANCGLRIADGRTAFLGMVLVGLLATVVLAKSYSDRATEVAKLSSEQKAELLRKKDRFDKLTDAERQRLRDIHAELEASPDNLALKTVMGNYCNWLRNLSSRDRDQVLSLPADERIKRIKEIVSRQEAQRFSDYVRFYLPKSDQQAIYKFLDEFVTTHEQEILDRLDDNERRWVSRIDDEQARRKSLISKLTRQFRGDASMPFPSSDEMASMVKSLSEETRTRLEAPAVADRNSRVQELVGAAIWSIAMPPPSEEELRKLLASLSNEERGRLEEMDPDKMQQALRFMHRAKQFQGGRWGPRGPRPGPPPGPPPGPLPPGFASPSPK